MCYELILWVQKFKAPNEKATVLHFQSKQFKKVLKESF